ncbi:HAD family hydrolase [Planctomycetota bacterium]
MDTKNAKAVIFDLDGVLVDTGEFHKQSWNDLASKQGWAFSDEIFQRTFGMQNYQIIPILVGGEVSSDEIDRLGEEKEARYRELIAGKLTLLTGVRDLIGDLKANGFLLAVGTSTPRVNLEFMLEHTHVRDSFDAFVTSEDVQNGKPAPDTFVKAAQKLSVPAERCVVVEDAVQGVEAGKAAGMAVVAVTTTRPGTDLIQADRIVDNLAELAAADFDKLLGPLD